MHLCHCHCTTLKLYAACNCQEAQGNEPNMSGDGGDSSSQDPLVGFRVLRRFAGFGEFWGSIVGSRHIDGARNWYRVDYDDGDSEEYNLKEVQRMAEYACAKAAHDPQGLSDRAEPLARALSGLAEDQGEAPAEPVSGRTLAAAAPPVSSQLGQQEARSALGCGDMFGQRKVEVNLLGMGFPASAVKVRRGAGACPSARVSIIAPFSYAPQYLPCSFVQDALAKHGADQNKCVALLFGASACGRVSCRCALSPPLRVSKVRGAPLDADRGAIEHAARGQGHGRGLLLVECAEARCKGPFRRREGKGAGNKQEKRRQGRHSRLRARSHAKLCGRKKRAARWRARGAGRRGGGRRGGGGAVSVRPLRDSHHRGRPSAL